MSDPLEPRVIMIGEMPQGGDAGWSTCPLCERNWLVTPMDDCMMPVCGCYGHDSSENNPERPCQSCGIKHAWSCDEVKRLQAEWRKKHGS